MRCVRAVSRSASVVRRTTSTSRLNASSTCPPSRSRSATSVWASTSSGFAAAAARASVRSTPSVRLSSLAMASPAAASASAGLASTSFSYSATAPSMSPRSSASWAGTYRGASCSSPVSSSTGPCPERGWWRPVNPLAVSCCSTWVTTWRRSSIGAASWISGIGRPCATSTTSGTDGICIAWAIWGTASMSTRPSRKRPSNSLERVWRSSASRTLSGERLGLSKASSTGALREPSSTSWKFCSVTETAYAALVPGPPAGPEPSDPCNPCNPDRSTAPGREKGCSLMAPLFPHRYWSHNRPPQTILRPVGWAEPDRDVTPARRQVLRSTAWLVGYVLASLLGRAIVLDNNVNVVSPAAGIALVWLAGSSRRMLPVDAVLLGLSTMAVIALTDGGTARTILSVVVVLQILLTLWLMRRLVPDIWGTGGRVPFTRLPQFGWLLVSIVVATFVAMLVRTVVGIAVTPEGWDMLIGRFGRQGSAMATIGILGLLLGGWITQQRDRGEPVARRPSPSDLLHAFGIELVAGLLFVVFWQDPGIPTTYILSLTVVWCAIRFSP